MSEIIEGKIEKVEQSQGTSSKGQPYTRWAFTIDGKLYSTFDADIGSVFKVGDYVRMSGELKGKYWNMKTMTKIDNPPQQVNEPENSKNLKTDFVHNDLTKVIELLELILAEVQKENDN